MNVLTSDWEVTTNSKGSAFDQRNKPVCLGQKRDDNITKVSFTTGPILYAQLYVFFNAKFDLHWDRKVGNEVKDLNIWCCQLAEFLLEGQTNPYPSLENTAIKYGLGHKVDIVKTEYWDKGICTSEIPEQILIEYTTQDVDLTYQIYLKQVEQFKDKPKLYKLFRLMCQDLLVLEEMEWNGLKFDPEKCLKKEEELDIEITKIKQGLSTIYPDIPINFGSGDQLSAFLYGGTITETVKEQVGFFKTGEKKGQPKYQNVEKVHTLPRLVTPLKGTELKKEGYWKTDVQTLQKLKGQNAKKFVGPLLLLSKLDKLNSTYYRGLLEKAKEHHWEENMIHGQFHQVVAGTGRLSSSNPNLQNFAEECQDIFISRYNE